MSSVEREELMKVLVDVTHRIWRDMFQSGEAPRPVSSETVNRATEVLVAHVDIRGEWNGRISCIGTPSTVHQLAQAVVGESMEIGDDRVRDCLAEITNVTGGNVKSALPGECALSSPYVGVQADCLESKERRLQLSFSTLQGPWSVILQWGLPARVSHDLHSALSRE